jgi:hypothetical protein
VDEGTARIELRRRDKPSLWAVVDLADLERVRPYSWLVLAVPGKTYAQAWTRDKDGRRRNNLLHRLVIDAPKGVHVDHINHDGLDNRRANLRLATRSQNQANMRAETMGATSKYKGVSWEKFTQRWKACITVHGKGITLGRYRAEEEAARAYDVAAAAFFGEFACLNFPDNSVRTTAAS